jgi:hypothetical protein
MHQQILTKPVSYQGQPKFIGREGLLFLAMLENQIAPIENIVLISRKPCRRKPAAGGRWVLAKV